MALSRASSLEHAENLTFKILELATYTKKFEFQYSDTKRQKLERTAL